MSKKTLGITVVILGFLIFMVFILADVIGASQSANRFGYKQIIGVIVGLLILVVGVVIYWRGEEFLPVTTDRMGKGFGWLKWPVRAVVLVAVLLLGPLGVLAFGDLDLDTHWKAASRVSSGQAPDPRQEPAALVLVYGARAHNWRGAFGIHTWIAVKRRAAAQYTVYQAVGWNVYGGRPAVDVKRGPPDLLWYNAQPQLLLEHRGQGVDALIDHIEAAVAAYPYTNEYRVWPGPNSNTFTAFVARRVPQLGLDLPPTAVGKDYLPDGQVVDRMPSGTGWQVSLHGLLGLGLAWEEGIELNILGLAAGIDLNDLALRLPGIGSVSVFPRG